MQPMPHAQALKPILYGARRQIEACGGFRNCEPPHQVIKHHHFARRNTRVSGAPSDEAALQFSKQTPTSVLGDAVSDTTEYGLFTAQHATNTTKECVCIRVTIQQVCHACGRGSDERSVATL